MFQSSGGLGREIWDLLKCMVFINSHSYMWRNYKITNCFALEIFQGINFSDLATLEFLCSDHPLVIWGLELGLEPSCLMTWPVMALKEFSQFVQVMADSGVYSGSRWRYSCQKKLQLKYCGMLSLLHYHIQQCKSILSALYSVAGYPFFTLQLNGKNQMNITMCTVGQCCKIYIPKL